MDLYLIYYQEKTEEGLLENAESVMLQLDDYNRVMHILTEVINEDIIVTEGDVPQWYAGGTIITREI